jgi:hypothetical protein
MAMDESIFDKVPGLDELIQYKDFDELSDSEKALVMQFMSIEEYDDLRIPIRKASALFADEMSSVSPDPEIRRQILDRFSQDLKITEKRDWKGVFYYKIPLYQAGLAAMMLICLALYLGSAWSKKGEKMQYVTKLDTVFVEKLVPQTDLKEIAQVSAVPVKRSGHGMVGISKTAGKIDFHRDLPDTYSVQLRNVEQLVNMNRRAKLGRNAVDDSLLMKLLVSVN